MSAGAFEFESMGIGTLLRRTRLQVPTNQRPYAWDEQHVRTLLEDFNEAIQRDDEDYFLGTIVLVQKGKDVPAIADGQQRLATTSILLARIRDRQFALGRGRRAGAIDAEYLRSVDMDTEESVSRLQLNTEDHEFYSSDILQSPQELPESEKHVIALPPRPSNMRLKVASIITDTFLNEILAPYRAESHSDTLNRWVTFLRDSATVVVVTASDEVGAYRMFETLNDRGVQASQADILKNFIFSKAGSRTNEAQVLWHSIVASIESLPDDVDQRLVTFIRHFWILTHGPTKERELAAQIKGEISGETRALNFLDAASNAVQDYCALWSAQHPAWARHRPSTRNSIDTIAQHLRVEQIRPLLFAIIRHFDSEEAAKALRLCVSWSVRFLVYGGRGGLLDQQYSLRAQEIGTGRITKARQLREAMERYVPTDVEFETAFSTARVSRARLARYYLRALEKTAKGDAQPEFVANEDVSQITLDHVLPLIPGDDWELREEEVEAGQKLLGNMVLLRAKDNRDLANKSFQMKRERYAESGYYTTQTVAEEKSWGLKQIRDRQAGLARLAIQTWKMSFD